MALWPPVGEVRQARHLPPPPKCLEKIKIDKNELQNQIVIPEFKILLYLEHSRTISENSFKWFKYKFVNKFSGSHPLENS
jgi:hypothetical protein